MEVYTKILRYSRKLHPVYLNIGLKQIGRPAELKHINKRRKRNQQGFP